MDSLAWLSGQNPKSIDLYYIKPKYQPPYIDYTWPGEPTISVEGGDSYTLEESVEYLLGDYNVYCRVVYEIQIKPKNDPVGYTDQLRLHRLRNASGPFVPIIDPIWVTVNDPNQCFGNYQIQYLDLNGVIRKNPPNGPFSPQCIEPPGFNWQTGQAYRRRCVAVFFEQIDQLKPDTTIKTCTIKIFDKEGELIEEDSRSSENQQCPTVTRFPESCFYDFSDQRFLTEIHEATPTIQFNIRQNNNGNQKCTVLERYLYDPSQDLKPPDPFDPILDADVLEEICSDENCDLYPLICFSCPSGGDDDDNDNCKDCPPGTIYQVLDGNTLLCVASDGCVLDQLEYDPKCHRVDCQC